MLNLEVYVCGVLMMIDVVSKDFCVEFKFDRIVFYSDVFVLLGELMDELFVQVVIVE